jgi:hypothetical protein
MSGEGQNLELDDYIVKKYEVKKRIGKGVSHTPVPMIVINFWPEFSFKSSASFLKFRKSVGLVFFFKILVRILCRGRRDDF